MSAVIKCNLDLLDIQQWNVKLPVLINKMLLNLNFVQYVF